MSLSEQSVLLLRPSFADVVIRSFKASSKRSNCKMNSGSCKCFKEWGVILFFKPQKIYFVVCTFNYACYNESMTDPAPIPTPHNVSLFDPCFWSYCGSGKCVKTSGFKHRCECKKGFSNILNITSLPCVKDCTVAADCRDLGFPLSNGNFPPSPTNFIRNSGQASSSQNNLLQLLCATLVMVQTIWMKF